MICCSVLLFALFSFTAQAQNEFKKGTITLDKGKTVEAYILIDFRYPQRFQSSITYITPGSYAKFQKKGKIKKKKKIKLKPKDIDGFALDNGTTFKTVTYVDLSKKTIGMLPKKICLEQLVDGKIAMYKMYSKTSGKMSYELSNVIMDSKMDGDDLLIDYIKDNFQLLVQKDTKNPKNVAFLNLLRLIGDNERVKENYANNHYGLRDQFTEDRKEGKLVNTKYETAFLKMVQDYNGTLSK